MFSPVYILMVIQNQPILKFAKNEMALKQSG